MENPNLTETQSSPIPGKKTSIPRWLITIVSIQALAIIALVSALIYFSLKPTDQPTSQNNTPTQPIQQNSQTSAQSVQAFFLKENQTEPSIGSGKDIWTIDSTGKEVQVSKLENSVAKYVYSADHSVLAYIEKRKVEKKDGIRPYTVDEPIKIWLQHVGQPAQAIFSLEPTTRADAEYTIQIRDLNITPDGKKVVYSTSDSIYLFDVSTNQTKTVLSRPITGEIVRGIIYAYSALNLSPDYKTLLFTQNYYEGGTYQLINIESGEQREVTQINDFFGTRVFVFWQNPSQLLVVESSGLGSDEPQLIAKTISTTDLSISKTWEFTAKSVAMSGVYDEKNNKIYTLGSSLSSIPASTGKNLIQQLDLQSGKVQIWPLDPQTASLEGLELSPDRNTLFTRSFTQGEIGKNDSNRTSLMKFDLTHPESGLMIVSTAATL